MTPLEPVHHFYSTSCRHSNRHADNTLENPTYSPAMPITTPSVQYSSLGPHDTPTTGHTPPQREREDRNYQEVGVGEGEGEEGVYHLLGEEGGGATYEVPIQGGGERAVEMTYSTLQHT